MGIETDKILIEIASYKDPELLNTVHSALIQADHPERVHFSICYQNDDKSDLYELEKIDHCKIANLNEADAKGSCYARYLCQQMIDDEKYVYQIDSHMRFVKHWDTKMIEQLLSFHDDKAIISFYPEACTEEMMTKPLDDEVFDHPTCGTIMYVNYFHDGDSYFISANSIPVDKDDYRVNHRNALIGAGNFFTFSEAHKEVLHDPYMYFYGDELPMSIRLFTHGWNIYTCGEGYIYHQYERKNQDFPTVPEGMYFETDRLKALLGLSDKKIDLGEFGLGNVRTVKEFEDFSGLRFKDKIIYLNAETGEFDNAEYRNKLSFYREKLRQENDYYCKEETIEVLIVDLFGEYEDCIRSAIENATHSKNIKFIVGTKSKNNLDASLKRSKSVKKIVFEDENASYSKILSDISLHVGKDYVLIIDSSIRFVQGWDSHLTYNIKRCGNQSALTCWTWIPNEGTDIRTFGAYQNCIREFDYFYYFLPVLKYNDGIDLQKRGKPYATPFMVDGFLFLHSNILKKVKIDPNISYEEFKYLYSLRLWTYGITIYYPDLSFFFRLKDESLLSDHTQHLDVLCGVSRIRDLFYTKDFPVDYSYDIGMERSLWSYYESFGVRYNPYSYSIEDNQS